MESKFTEKIDNHPYWKTYIRDFQPYLTNNHATAEKVNVARRKEIIKHIFKRFLIDFAEGSSFQGLRHLVTHGRHWGEHVFWAVMISAAVGMTIYVNILAWFRYSGNPVVIVMERNYRDFNISFPTATICPFERTDNETLYNIADRYNVKDRNAFVEFFTALASSEFETFNYLPDYDEIPPDEFLKIVVEAARNFTYTLSTTLNVNHEELEPVLTEVGICYAYNSKIAPFFNPEAMIGFKERAERLRDLQYSNIMDGQAFATVTEVATTLNISITSPYELPYIGTPFIEFFNKGLLSIEVECLPIVSTDDVRNLPRSRRYCRTRSDDILRVSSIYSFNLCRIDCKMDLSYKMCGCVPYMHVTDGSKPAAAKLPICDVAGMKCLARNGTLIADLRDRETRKRVPCDCRPLCTDFHFNINLVDRNKWTKPEVTWQVRDFPKLRFKRTIIFDITDFIVSVGASAGFFLGCSLLSFVEVFYFVTLRLGLYAYTSSKEKRERIAANAIRMKRFHEFLH